MLLLIACNKQPTDFKVHYAGALKTMMSGNLDATVSLDSLSRKRNIYALGAFENLKGEIQIFDGMPSNSIVNGEEVEIYNSFDARAALLVWTQVPEWIAIEIPSTVKNQSELEKFISKQAADSGLDVEKPFPFLLEGKTTGLDWHVIDWLDGDMVHTHEKHKEAGLNGSLENAEVDILGFYSTKHQAIFTHHTTFMHMHFKTKDGDLAGHVDTINLNGNIQLKLPRQ